MYNNDVKRLKKRHLTLKQATGAKIGKKGKIKIVWKRIYH